MKKMMLAVLVLCAFSSMAMAALNATVSWNDVTGETSYIVQRSDNGGAFVTQVTTAADVVSFNQSLPALNVPYCYTVTAANAFGNGPASAPVCVTPATPGQVTINFVTAAP